MSKFNLDLYLAAKKTKLFQWHVVTVSIKPINATNHQKIAEMISRKYFKTYNDYESKCQSFGIGYYSESLFNDYLEATKDFEFGVEEKISWNKNEVIMLCRRLYESKITNDDHFHDWMKENI